MSGRDIRIEVAVGSASPPAITLRAGQSRDPFSVGLDGSWSVAAPGMGSVHAHFVFDGATLHVASANPDDPVLLDGAAAPDDWIPVSIPCELRIAGATLHVRWARTLTPSAPAPMPRSPDSERTQIAAPRLPTKSAPAEREAPASARASASAPPRPRERPMPPSSGPSSERTRIAPIESMHALPPSSGAASGAAPEPRASSPSRAPSTPFFQVPAPPSPSSHPLAPTPTPAFPLPPQRPQSPTVVAKRGAWAQASIPKRITYILLPVALVGTGYALLADDEEPSRPRASSSAEPSASSPRVSASPPSSTPPKATAVASAQAPPDMPSARASVKPRSSAAPSGSAKRTLERQAADLVAAGAYGDAAKVLDELAAEEPSRAEYREAARILRAKAGERP